MPFIVPTLLLDSTDLILKSADGVEFRVHKTFLSQASSMFESMFLIPQAPAASDSPGPDGELASVDLAESGDVLSVLLMCMYPVEKTRPESLDVLRGSLQAARKYNMTLAISILRKDLTWPGFVRSDPLAVYSIACVMGLREEAEAVAVETLEWSVPDLASRRSSMGDLLAVDFSRLLTLRNRRAKSIIGGIDHVNWIFSGGHRTACKGCDKLMKAWSKMARNEAKAWPSLDHLFSLAYGWDLTKNSPACTCEEQSRMVKFLERCEKAVKGLKVPDLFSEEEEGILV